MARSVRLPLAGVTGSATVLLIVAFLWFPEALPTSEDAWYVLSVLVMPLTLGVIAATWRAVPIPLAATVSFFWLAVEPPPQDSEYGYGVILLALFLVIAPACLATAVGVAIARAFGRSGRTRPQIG